MITRGSHDVQIGKEFIYPSLINWRTFRSTSQQKVPHRWTKNAWPLGLGPTEPKDTALCPRNGSVFSSVDHLPVAATWLRCDGKSMYGPVLQRTGSVLDSSTASVVFYTYTTLDMWQLYIICIESYSYIYICIHIFVYVNVLRLLWK